MILDVLADRSSRERWAIGLTSLVAAVIVCYLAGVGPAVEYLEGTRKNLETRQTSLDLQGQQLEKLHVETARHQETLDRLKNVPCPWVAAEQVDTIFQGWQKQAAELGLTVRSVIRERQVTMRIEDNTVPVSTVAVRIRLVGPYEAVMKMLTKLDDTDVPVGLEEITVHGLDTEPYDLEVSLLVRMAVCEGKSHV